MDIFDGRQEGRGISIQYNILYKDCRTVPAINKIYCVHGSIKKQHFCKKRLTLRSTQIFLVWRFRENRI